VDLNFIWRSFLFFLFIIVLFLVELTANQKERGRTVSSLPFSFLSESAHSWVLLSGLESCLSFAAAAAATYLHYFIAFRRDSYSLRILLGMVLRQF